jgi:hypothetical protein
VAGRCLWRTDVFLSLDRVDIVLKPGPDGGPRCVQTDYRIAAEIEQEPDISVIFAIIRVLNSKRIVEPGSPEPVVICSSPERPPTSSSGAIRAAGGHLVVGDLQQLLSDPGEPAALEEIVESAFTNLARAVGP